MREQKKLIMPISEKTRKLLWAKSGNRCAICRQKLVIDKTNLDLDSIVGDECHIISGKKNGPRFDKSFPTEIIDEEDNLIVLCKVHHKMIDDQPEKYTSVLLKEIKCNHIKWIDSKLEKQSKGYGFKILRNRAFIPNTLLQIESGKRLLEMSSSCACYYKDYPENLDEKETEIVGGFIQEVIDWSDISNMVEPIDLIRASKTINDKILELNDLGFIVFSGVEKQIIENSDGTRETWNAFHIAILRNNDERIVKQDVG